MDRYDSKNYAGSNAENNCANSQYYQQHNQYNQVAGSGSNHNTESRDGLS